MLAVLWPILSIAYSYALYSLIAVERQGFANRFGFLMAVAAFVILAKMLLVQSAVRMGIEGYKAVASAVEQSQWQMILRGARLVDMGLDVAWDMLIGAF